MKVEKRYQSEKIVKQQTFKTDSIQENDAKDIKKK